MRRQALQARPTNNDGPQSCIGDRNRVPDRDHPSHRRQFTRVNSRCAARPQGAAPGPSPPRIAAKPQRQSTPRGPATVTRMGRAPGVARLRWVSRTLASQPRRARGLGRPAGKPGDRARSCDAGAQRLRTKRPPKTASRQKKDRPRAPGPALPTAAPDSRPPGWASSPGQSRRQSPAPGQWGETSAGRRTGKSSARAALGPRLGP